jgi:hypothetical protein
MPTAQSDQASFPSESPPLSAAGAFDVTDETSLLSPETEIFSGGLQATALQPLDPIPSEASRTIWARIDRRHQDAFDLLPLARSVRFSRPDLLRRLATDFRYKTKAWEAQAWKRAFIRRQRKGDPGLFTLSKP